MESETNLNQFPKGWVRTKVGDIFEFAYGKGLVKSVRKETGSYPVYGSSGVVGFHDEYVATGPKVIVGRKGAAGAVHYCNENCWPIDTTYFINSINAVDSKFSYYLLKSLRLNQFETSTAIPGLNRDDAYRLNISLPPLPEQKRIVAKIEELFSELDNGIVAIKTAREQLKIYRQSLLKYAFEGKLTARWRAENADKLETPEQLLGYIQKERDSHYHQQLEKWKVAVKKWEAKGKEGKKPKKPAIFKPMPTISKDEVDVLPTPPAGWRYVRLAEISAISSGMSVSQNRKLNNPLEVAYLRVANVQRGLIDLSEIKTMLVEQEALADLTLEKGDVLFNEGGDRDKLGRGWIWESQIEPCITQNHVFRASPFIKSEFHSKFISHWGNSFGKDYFDKGGKQTTNLASINKTVLSNFPVPLPSFEEQHQIISILDDAMSQMDRLESEIEKRLLRAEILRQSILKKAFSGQLVKQNPSDEPASELLARIRAEKEQQRKLVNKSAIKPSASSTLNLRIN